MISFTFPPFAPLLIDFADKENDAKINANDYFYQKTDEATNDDSKNKKYSTICIQTSENEQNKATS